MESKYPLVKTGGRISARSTVLWRTPFMLENKGIAIGSDIILMLFTMSLFFLYFSSFFRKRKAGDKRLIIGVIVLAIWQFCIMEYKLDDRFFIICGGKHI